MSYDEEYRKRFARNLRRAMLLRGKSQADISRDLDFVQATVSTWCTGNKLPRPSKMKALADYLGVTIAELVDQPEIKGGWFEKIDLPETNAKIPILGSVPAGIPIEMIQDIEGEVDICGNPDDYGALRVKGHSMEPLCYDGDIVIFRIQPACDSGQIAIVRVGSNEATLKKVIYDDSKTTLKPLNPDYPSLVYERNIDEPYFDENEVTIIGVVKEIRRRV